MCGVWILGFLIEENIISTHTRTKPHAWRYLSTTSQNFYYIILRVSFARRRVYSFCNCIPWYNRAATYKHVICNIITLRSRLSTNQIDALVQHAACRDVAACRCGRGACAQRRGPRAPVQILSAGERAQINANGRGADPRWLFLGLISQHQLCPGKKITTQLKNLSYLEKLFSWKVCYQIFKSKVTCKPWYKWYEIITINLNW